MEITKEIEIIIKKAITINVKEKQCYFCLFAFGHRDWCYLYSKKLESILDVYYRCNECIKEFGVE